MIQEFFENLKIKREESGKTQQAMADLLDISIKQYQKYEYNRLPRHIVLLEINQILSHDFSRYIYQQKVPSETIPEEINQVKENLSKLILSIGRLAGLSKEKTYEVFSSSALDNKLEKVEFQEFPVGTPRGKSSKRRKLSKA